MYSFTGNAGDLVQATARNWVGTLNPHLDLVGPDGQIADVAASSLLTEDSLEASLSLFLPQTGIYMLLVSAEGGTIGEYMLKLQGRGAVDATPLVYGQGVTATLPANPERQYYAFEAEDCPTAFIVANLAEGQPFTFPFMVTLRNEGGDTIALLRGGDALEDRAILAPLSGRYEVALDSDDPAATGAVFLLITCLDQAPGCITGGANGGLCDPISCYESGLCGDFQVTVTPEGGGVMTFTWPALEGAQWYIFSIIDATGALLADSPIMLVDETSHTYIVRPEDAERGPFTAFVQAGGETMDEGLRCTDSVPFSLAGATTDACRGIDIHADVIPADDRQIALSWSAAPGAGVYLIHVYAYDIGGLIAIRILDVPGSITTYHLSDLFPAGYNRFHLRVAAYEAPEGGGDSGDMPTGYLCDGGIDVEFAPRPTEWSPAAPFRAKEELR